MSSPISDAFTRCRDEHRTALIAYVTGGHPSLEDTAAALSSIADAGADLIEIGLPFSDPIADGPVIAEAMHEALVAGVTPRAVIDVIGGRAGRLSPPMLAMVSCSIVHRVGAEPFVGSIARAGIRGLIVPDLDVQADEDAVADPRTGGMSLRQRCADAGIDLVLLAAPTTSPARLERIAAASRGFLYVIARTGITGDRGSADLDELARRIERLRTMTDTPLAVGFGVSTPAHVAELATLADGVIVGTALVRRMAEAGVGNAAGAAADLVRALAAATERRLERRGR